MPFDSIKHTEKSLTNGGMVLILNTGAVINPEAEAMLQALHSRSTGGIKEHLQTLEKKGADKFMASFYVGYGHKSIGDCGSITIFIEGVSMLAAKAIQDWPLYSGQESSTRYVDFSKQKFIDPIKTTESNKLLETWRTFYLDGLTPVQEYLKSQFPIQPDQKESTYLKAIAARAFDIMRGYLPAGASTNLAWHTNLRQAADKLMLLRHHPLKEVQELAETIEQALIAAHPSSFEAKRYDETENYNQFWMKKYNYFDQSESYGDQVALLRNDIDTKSLENYREVLEKRPPKTELPKFLAECGTLQFGFMLDFGSFRDIQRHRAVKQRMPLVTTKHGFNQFYINSLPESLRPAAKNLLDSQAEEIKNLNTTPEIAQYYTAMGYNLPNKVTGDLPSLVYLVELRATRFVHPTLRDKAAAMAEIIKKEFGPLGLKLHLDNEPGIFDIKRGEHDIVKK
ncbi:MAG: FAD-dependent thymidylate synthase [Candidatus Buchananbacteria bacterium]|nr:FAD-dependent thymidylate synthase [Candidatus Buchananbacteria bacterium]